MLVYSAIKNNANGPAAYSTLNPDTNSDSPSVRSKGARFVSARVEINHIRLWVRLAEVIICVLGL